MLTLTEETCSHNWEEVPNLIGGWEIGKMKRCTKCDAIVVQMLHKPMTTPQPKSLEQILTDFDEQFNHDDPNGVAIVFRSSDDGSTTQCPVQDALKEFIRESYEPLLKTLHAYEEAIEKMKEMDSDSNCECERGTDCSGCIEKTERLWRTMRDDILSSLPCE